MNTESVKTTPTGNAYIDMLKPWDTSQSLGYYHFERKTKSWNDVDSFSDTKKSYNMYIQWVV